jgi:hypothetical protein
MQMLSSSQSSVLDNYGAALRWCQARMTKHISTAETQDDIEFKTLTRVDTSQQVNEASLALFTPPPHPVMVERMVSADACHDLGILWNPDKKAWIFPIRDPYTQELWGWQEKSRHDTRNRPRDVDKSRAVFGSGAFAKGDRAVVVESPVDTARFLTAGIRGAVSGYGVQLSIEQLGWLRRYASRVVLAFDNDSAGVRATAKCIAALRGLPVRVYDYGVVGLHDHPGVPDTTPKDPGEQSNAELRYGLEHAVSALRWRA